MKNLLIYQPGRSGDILVCLPIAHYYSKSYNVYWSCPVEYHNIFRNIDYCTPVPDTLEWGGYDKVIDLSYGFARTPVHDWWIQNRSMYSDFITPKYVLADVSIQFQKMLVWNRNIERENALYEYIMGDSRSKPYYLTHESTWNGKFIDIDCENKIEFTPILDYNIFDWYKIIVNASEIHCIPSCLFHMADVIPMVRDTHKVLYQYEREPKHTPWMMCINNNNWTINE